jgi:hypothetical protein
MSKRKTPVSRTETITPKKAEEYLKSNTRNRRVREKTVDFYAEQMKNGEWMLNGESIIFDEEGTLLNGQHRLLACIRSGVNFQTFVVRGAPADSFRNIDQGAIRTAGDIVGMEDFKYANRKAAAAKLLMCLEELEKSKGQIERPRLGTKRSHGAILDAVIDHDELLQEGCLWMTRDDAKAYCRPGATFVGVYAYLAKKNRTRADEFFQLLVSGENITRHHPVNRLRALLVSSLSDPNKKRKKVWIIAVILKAWNAFMRDQEVKNLKFSESERWPRVATRRVK